jgi:hypothetical protein
MCEWKGVRFVVHQIEDGDSVAHGRQETVAILGEDKVAFAIDGAEQVGELCFCQWLELACGEVVPYMKIGLHPLNGKEWNVHLLCPAPVWCGE